MLVTIVEQKFFYVRQIRTLRISGGEGEHHMGGMGGCVDSLQAADGIIAQQESAESESHPRWWFQCVPGDTQEISRGRLSGRSSLARVV